MFSSTTPATPSLEYLAEDCRHGPRIGIIITTAVSFGIVSLRIYLRIKFKNFALDDVLIILAWTLSLVVMSLDLRILNYGAGLHMAALTPDMKVLLFKHLVASQMVYMITLGACRASGLAFYSRLTKDINRFNIYLWIALAFITATFLVQFLLVSLQCIPLKRLWEPTVPGTCLGNRLFYLLTAALTIACDVLVLLLPLSVVVKLQTTLVRKLALGFVLCFGIFAVITSVFRMFAMVPAADSKTDPTWYFARIMAWSTAEMSTAIIALSIPALKPIFSFVTEPDGSTKKDTSERSEPRFQVHEMNNLASGASRYRQKKGRAQVDAVSLTNSSEENLWDNQTAARSEGRIT